MFSKITFRAKIYRKNYRRNHRVRMFVSGTPEESNIMCLFVLNFKKSYKEESGNKNLAN